MVSMAVQKLLSLIRSHLFIFAFVSLTLEDRSKKIVTLITQDLLYFHESESKVVSDSLQPTLCNSMDCSLWGSSIHEIFQARVLERVAISFSRASFLPRYQTWVSGIASRRFYCLSHQGSSRIYFHTNLKILCFNSEKNVIDNLIGVPLNLWITLGSMAILAILILLIQEHSIFFFLIMSSSISFTSIL